jgi:hypothetical protein
MANEFSVESFNVRIRRVSGIPHTVDTMENTTKRNEINQAIKATILLSEPIFVSVYEAVAHVKIKNSHYPCF